MGQKDRQQSGGLILLQIIGILLGFFSAFYIAGELEPEMYSLIGVYAIISSLSLVFSSTGMETLAIRNILDLQANNKDEELQQTVTIAISARFVIALVVAIPIGLYGYYMSSTKFGGDYLSLILLMTVAGIFRSVNDSVNLLLKGFNKYFLSALSTYTVTSFGRIVALVTFVKFGLEAYFITVFLIPVIVTAVSITYLLRYINWRTTLDLIQLRKMAKQSRPFLLSTYLSYIYTNLDQLIASVLLSAEGLGTFSLAKNIWNMAKTFIENVFDPLCQKGVKFKRDVARLEELYKDSLRVQKIMFLCIALSLMCMWLYLGTIISLIGLQNYPHLDLLIYSIVYSAFFYVLVKTKLNFATLFMAPDYYFRISIIQALVSLFLLIAFLLFDETIVFCYLGTSYLVLYLFLSKTMPKKDFAYD